MAVKLLGILKRLAYVTVGSRSGMFKLCEDAVVLFDLGHDAFDLGRGCRRG